MQGIWRRRADSNRRTRICSPLPCLSATSPLLLRLDIHCTRIPFRFSADYQLCCWCRGRDSNPHAHKDTTPSTLPVYQFQHLGAIFSCRRLCWRVRSAVWQVRRDSNPRPLVLETSALPTELRTSVCQAHSG